MLDGVKCLILRLSEGDDTDIYQFLATTPNVQHLDLFDDDEPILDVLRIPVPKIMRNLLELRCTALDALVFSQGYIENTV
ncbi:hypothetical protein B0H11DRAFT_2219974 [Mycena galericulata]|nr:hypothetical protein B0H11DRAFT_2219974 [Mycena galericulata]